MFGLSTYWHIRMTIYYNVNLHKTQKLYIDCLNSLHDDTSEWLFIYADDNVT